MSVCRSQHLLEYPIPGTGIYLVPGTILIVMDEERKRVPHWFFVKGLGLALAVKLCPDQPQAILKVNLRKAFPQEETTSERTGSRYSEPCL